LFESDLYQEFIIDHGKNPHNRGVLEGATHHAEGFNPLCGDQVTLYFKVVDDVITDASFTGEGCAISTASASILTDLVKSKTVVEVENIFVHFHNAMLSKDFDPDVLDVLNALVNVREYPMRVKCATMAWHTLKAALKPIEGGEK
jgi:nitrogen fixation NifU-like protein